MAFNGLLFKFGEYDFRNVIKANTYKITPNARQDRDSYADANGLLRRNALKHTATKVEFTIRFMHEYEHDEMMKKIVKSYLNYNERDAICDYYDPETCQYKTGHFYIDSNLQFTIYGTYHDEITYNEFTFKFVEY